MRRTALLDRRIPVAVALAVSVFALAACGDDPFEVQWASNIDTVTLFSIQRPELGLASAFNFPGRLRVVIESPQATDTWDVAVDDDGSTAFLVPSGGLGVESRAAVATLPGIPFDDVTEAPGDTSVYVRDAPVPMEIGTTYAVRSRELPGFFGQRCVYYSKLQPIEFDPDRRSLVFFYEASPACNDRNLVPTQEN